MSHTLSNALGHYLCKGRREQDGEAPDFGLGERKKSSVQLPLGTSPKALPPWTSCHSHSGSSEVTARLQVMIKDQRGNRV